VTFADRARAAQRLQGPPCGVRTLLETLPVAYRAEVLAAIDDPVLPAPAVADVLIADGHPVSVDKIRRHRNRGTAAGCACPR
jgi:hypothetical protein